MLRLVFCLMLLIAVGELRLNRGYGQTVVGPPLATTAPDPDIRSLYPRIPGEFEPQRAILLSVSDLKSHHSKVLVQIVDLTANHVPLIILCNNRKQLLDTTNLLANCVSDKSHVSFCELPLDTIWLRDFGPVLAETQTGSVSIDFFYDGQRPLDDRLPITWSRKTGSDLLQVRWTLHGGNLICNGRGLGITTARIYRDNYIRFVDPLPPGRNPEVERRQMVDEAFKQQCNLHKLIVLEPLQQEATQHVDMFARFLAPDHVLVARLNSRSDPANARLLDRNAAKLQRLNVDGRPLRVSRILIPPRIGQAWSPYTNTISANKLVLMPVFKTDPTQIVEAALDTYRSLLPDHRVAAVDCTSMHQLQGSLHCMSVNIPDFAPLPADLISYHRAAQWSAAENSQR